MAKSHVDPSWQLLYSPETIAARIAELGKEISTALAGRKVLALPLLTGGMFFAADLLRVLDLDLQISPIGLKSYSGTASTGKMEVVFRSKIPPAGFTVLVIDDVLDGGATMQKGCEMLLQAGALETFTCVFCEKPLSARVPGGIAHADFAAFQSPTGFLVGYGMDWDERYRDLPAVYRCNGF